MRSKPGRGVMAWRADAKLNVVHLTWITAMPKDLYGRPQDVKERCGPSNGTVSRRCFIEQGRDLRRR